MTNLDLIQDAIRLINDENSESAINVLKQFVRANTATPKLGKLNIFNWVATDNLRPQMTGVFHDIDKKCAVASDMRVLIIVKSLYQEPSEGAIINEGGHNSKGYVITKKGEFVKDCFPDYERAIPRFTEDIEIDFERLRSLLREVKADEKVLNKECLGINVSVTPEKPLFLKPKHAKLLLTLPSGKFSVIERMILKFESDDHDVVAVMMAVEINESLINQPTVWSNKH